MLRLPNTRRRELGDEPIAYRSQDPAVLASLAGDLKVRAGQAYEAARRFGDGILQMGTSLVCNFFEELGLLYDVKVDVHEATSSTSWR